jgi:hypothetical protein
VQTLSEALARISKVPYVHPDGSVDLHSPKSVTVNAGKDAVVAGMNRTAVQLLPASIECATSGKTAVSE